MLRVTCQTLSQADFSPWLAARYSPGWEAWVRVYNGMGKYARLYCLFQCLAVNISCFDVRDIAQLHEYTHSRLKWMPAVGMFVHENHSAIKPDTFCPNWCHIQYLLQDVCESVWVLTWFHPGGGEKA